MYVFIPHGEIYIRTADMFAKWAVFFCSYKITLVWTEVSDIVGINKILLCVN